MTNRKSHARFRLMPKSTTLDDLEGHYALCFKIHASFGDQHENLNENRATLSERKCSSMTLVSNSIRFMRIFAGVPWKGGVKRQWVIKNIDFQGFRTLCLRHLRKWSQHCYIVPCRLSTVPKIRDLEWPFYVKRNFSLLLLHTDWRVCLHTWSKSLCSTCLYHATSRDVRKRNVIRRIFGIQRRTAALS